MIHPGLAALEKWDTIEYAAGYRARLAAIPDSDTAHHCWRCGWEDAGTEALELDRHKRVLADGREDDYPETWGLLFDAGGDARANGVPFDEGRTQPWKEGDDPEDDLALINDDEGDEEMNKAFLVEIKQLAEHASALAAL